MPTFPQIRAARRRIGARDFDFDHRIAVMAIINRTRDSFFDAGRTYELSRAVEAALEAAEAGAAIVNDTSGLWDPDMAPLVARTGATIILTHSRAEPHKHLRKPHYDDVVAEVRSFLVDRVERLLAAGASEDQLIVDPGPDLNKNTLHTLELCRRFDEITSIGLPTLAALSNKDFVGETLDRPRDLRLAGTLAATTWCIERGARIVRAHDVPRTVEVVRMTEALLGLREPAYLRHNLD